MLCESLPLIPPSPIHPQTELLVWGEAGGREELANKRGFFGTSGRELRKAMRQAGLRVDSAWPNDRRLPPSQETAAFSNVYLHRPPENKFPGPIPALECLDAHQPIEVRTSKLPWLACGANAVETLTGLRFKEFLDIRGSLLPVRQEFVDPYQARWVTATVHPAYIVRGGKEEKGKAQSSLYPLLVMDILRAKARPVPHIPLCKRATPSIIWAAWEGRTKRNPDVLCIDAEGRAPNLNIVGFSWEKGEAWVADWGPDTAQLLGKMFATPGMLPAFHNAAYDVGEFIQCGIAAPPLWIDTINLAALVNSQVKLSLEAQVLTYIAGTTTWKGLVDHKAGYETVTPKVDFYCKLWTTILRAVGRPVPATRLDWYCFYNALDTAYDYELAFALRLELEKQGRMSYYRDIMQPLQAPLVVMGMRGMPVDLERMKWHRTACERLERMAKTILDSASGESLSAKAEKLNAQIATLEAERAAEKASGIRAFSKSKELTSLRTKLRTAAENVDKGFNGDSAPQRVALLYGEDGLKLPVVKNRDTGNPTSDDDAVTSLISRLTRGTIKPKNATKDEALRICRAMVAVKKWATWRRNFLTPKSEEPDDEESDD